MKNNSVLVMGWEYPPRMVGGLAIATHELVKALSNFVQVHLLIPYKDKNTPTGENITVYGLNTLKDHLPSIEVKKVLSKKIYHTQKSEVSVYPKVDSSLGSKIVTLRERNEELDISYLSYFESDEVYGGKLWERIDAYKTLALLVSKYIPFDIIHCHDWLTFKAGVAVKKASGKPLAVHVHALETDRVGPHVRNEIYKIEMNGMETADVVFPVSHYTKACIVEHYEIDKDKIVPIYNAIADKEIKPWKHNIPQKIVTFLGRVTAQKGPQFLFDTIKKVVSKYKNVRFVIAGSGDMLQDLVMQGAYEELSKYIIYAGFINRDEVNALLSTTDVYFMPSVSEPFGLTALEAARAGTPCVLTKQSGAAEVLTSSLQADYWDTDCFAEHIIKLLKDVYKRNMLAKKQYKDMNILSWNSSAERVVMEYNQLLN